jgi:DNA polymerase-3 subunit chi
MTQVDFYVLDPAAPGDRYQLACRVAERARRAGKRVLIHSQVAAEATHVDGLLWTLWETGFVPHGMLGRDDPRCNPILIGDGSTDDNEHDVLINLATGVPSFFGRFDRLIECVDHDAEIKAASRERYRYYREHGYPLKTHTIS